MKSKLEEWKARWNEGDTKFVPELFEMVDKLIANPFLQQKEETRRSYPIWIDKYHGARDQGEYWDAHKIGEEEAESFDEAMKKHISKLAEDQQSYYRKTDGGWYCWGVKVFEGRY